MAAGRTSCTEWRKQVIEEMKRVFTSWHEGGFRVNISRHDEGAGPVYTIESPPHYSGFRRLVHGGAKTKSRRR